MLFFDEGVYPRMLNSEEIAVKEVLYSKGWNMCYGSNLKHEELEEKFAEYIGSKYAIAVNTGGMAIQMSLRALGLKPGDEVIHQVDTCVANAFSILNAQVTPIFADISLDTFLLSEESIESLITDRTKAIMPIHMWGNAENMDMIGALAKKHKLFILEDACLSLGSVWNGKKVGSFGDVGFFSFGCLKPLQTGEGGMIVTNNEAVARELRTIRNYGDRYKEYGTRDQNVLSWNGRISEILAAIALEQLRGYDQFLKKIEKNIFTFTAYLDSVKGFSVIGAKNNNAYSQLVLKIDECGLGMKKIKLFELFQKNNIAVWHANFEPINRLSFFKDNTWKDWVHKGDLDKVCKNYSGSFVNSEHVYGHIGIGLGRRHFLSEHNVLNLIKTIDEILKKRV